jgi:acyl-CoA thioesterase-1
MIRLVILSFFAFFSYLSLLSASTIMILGDSISAGYGVSLDNAWPSILEAELRNEHQIVNASISGDTSSGGLSRLQEGLDAFKPDVVVIELGGNDGLRGLSLEALEENLAMIVFKALEAGTEILICGMQIPSNYGPLYAGAFEEIYYDLAQDLGIPLVPRFIEAVALKDEMMQSDGIHPNERGHEELAHLVFPYILEALERVASK